MAAETPRPRVGIPYRTRNEEVTRNRTKYDKYFQAVRRAGGDPIEVSLSMPSDELRALERTLDAIVLPGSPADVDPERYHAARHPASATADSDRERTDFALLEHAFRERKPVLAICYGTQSMNVYLGGTLIQDIPSELHTQIQHPWANISRSVSPDATSGSLRARRTAWSKRLNGPATRTGSQVFSGTPNGWSNRIPSRRVCLAVWSWQHAKRPSSSLSCHEFYSLS
jgi:gamma-glutamyl-gamma-aminobutyrate hydrolase PuuD